MYKEKLLDYIKEHITTDEMTLQIIENIIDYANKEWGHSMHASLDLVSDMLESVIDYKDLEQFENLEPFMWYIEKHKAR